VSRLANLYMRMASAPANTRFRDLVSLAEAVGFVLIRQRGSHLLFRHRSNPRLRLNLQPRKGKAKEYQVSQLLAIIEQNNLWRW